MSYLSKQVGFSAYLGSSVTNATGNGTVFTIGTSTSLTEIFDLGGDFNTNGTFTAPVTGKYLLHMQALITNCTIASAFQISIVTTARAYNSTNPRAASNLNYNLNNTVIADMTAGDTATFTVNVSGEAGNTNTVFGGATNNWTSVSGYLLK